MKYHTKADSFFTEEEKEQIKVATIGVEARTIGEIATVVIDQSSEYKESHASVWAFIPFTFLLFFPARLLFQLKPAFKTAFIGRRRKEKSVKERALRTFYERGLYKTKKHTGVLFFLSLLERKVWVLADRGIHNKIHQETLNKFAGMVSKGIQEGRATDALCGAITGMGELLWEYYPITDADTDELPNTVICESDDFSTDREGCKDRN